MEAEQYAIVPLINSPEFKGADYAVWVSLCHYAEWRTKDGKARMKKGTCTPSYAEIARTAHCTVSTAMKSVKKLERLGYVVSTPRPGEYSERSRTSNSYFLKA